MLETTLADQTTDTGTTRQIGPAIFAPPEVRQRAEATFQAQSNSGLAFLETSLDRELSVLRPLVQSPVKWTEGETAALIQIWEGTVQEILPEENSIRALLRSKMGNIADHFVDIDLQWVSEQDRDLVSLGAVFYLSLYKARKRNGAVVNSEELRFRRLPAWTRRDAKRIKDEAHRLLAKAMTKPDAP